MYSRIRPDGVSGSTGVANDTVEHLPNFAQIWRPLIQEIQGGLSVVARSGDRLRDFVSQRGSQFSPHANAIHMREILTQAGAAFRAPPARACAQSHRCAYRRPRPDATLGTRRVRRPPTKSEIYPDTRRSANRAFYKLWRRAPVAPASPALMPYVSGLLTAFKSRYVPDPASLIQLAHVSILSPKAFPTRKSCGTSPLLLKLLNRTSTSSSSLALKNEHSPWLVRRASYSQSFRWFRKTTLLAPA